MSFPLRALGTLPEVAASRISKRPHRSRWHFAVLPEHSGEHGGFLGHDGSDARGQQPEKGFVNRVGRQPFRRTERESRRVADTLYDGQAVAA